jgi:hypothetical protein
MSKRRISTALSLAPDGARARTLRIIDAETMGPHGVIVSRAAAAQLTSVHTWSFVSELRAPDEERFTGTSVQVGMHVGPGVELIGRETARRDASGSLVWHRAGLMCPGHVEGRVSGVATSPERMEVQVRAEHALGLGDLLVVGEEAAVVVAIEESKEAFVLWPGVSGMHAVEKHGCAALTAHARATGPTSQVTESPLLGKANDGGQRLRASHIRLLREHGALFALHELLTVKSDDSAGRSALLASIARGAPECRATLPNSILALEATLRALALDVSFRSAKPGLRLASDASILAHSRGEVSRPETLNAKTHQAIAGGLFCEAIFGKRERHAHEDLAGHITLAAPVIHPLFVPEVMLLLGLDAQEFDAVMNDSRNFAGEETLDWRDTGTTALADALEAVDLDVVAEEESERGALARRMRSAKIAPTAFVFRRWPVAPTFTRPLLRLDDGRWATSDLNDLYRRLLNRALRLTRLVELKAPEIILIQESRSLQEAVAHLVDNSVTETPIRGENDKPLVSLMGLLAGPHASTAFGVLLQRGKPVDFSGAAVAVPCEDTFDHVRVPRAMAQKLFGPQIEAQRAASMSAHRDVDIERVLDDVTREQSVIVVPDREAQSMASLKLSVWDEHAIGIPIDVYEALLLAPGESVVIHLPLDPRAVDEVKHWRSHRTSLIDESNAGWIGRAMHGPVRTALIETLLRGEVDPLEDELTRLFLGRAPLATQH